MVKSIEGIQFREATSADVDGMRLCQLADPTAAGADPRMAAYFAGQHHPQQALLPRVGYVALANDEVIGYIAGHRTTRHDCAAEVQYLFVSSAFRRRGIATVLLQMLAEWFQSQNAQKVCVALAGDSPAEFQPFYESVGAAPLKRYWYGWEDIGIVPKVSRSPEAKRL